MTENTEKLRAPIPGFSRYEYDLLTGEIISKSGKSIEKRVDKRPGRGQTVVSLHSDSGSRSTVSFPNLVEKTLRSLMIKKRTDAILPKVLVSYYEKLDAEFKNLSLIQVSKAVHKDLPNTEILEIGRILNKIHTSANS